MVLANPTCIHGMYVLFWPTLYMCDAGQPDTATSTLCVVQMLKARRLQSVSSRLQQQQQRQVLPLNYKTQQDEQQQQQQQQQHIEGHEAAPAEAAEQCPPAPDPATAAAAAAAVASSVVPLTKQATPAPGSADSKRSLSLRKHRLPATTVSGPTNSTATAATPLLPSAPAEKTQATVGVSHARVGAGSANAGRDPSSASGATPRVLSAATAARINARANAAGEIVCVCMCVCMCVCVCVCVCVCMCVCACVCV